MYFVLSYPGWRLRLNLHKALRVEERQRVAAIALGGRSSLTCMTLGGAKQRALLHARLLEKRRWRRRARR